MGWALLSGDPCKLCSRQSEKEHKQLAGLSSEREHPHARQNTNKQNVLLGVSELTPSVPGLDNGARYPQRTHTKAARSHTDRVGLETGMKKMESHHPSTLPFQMPRRRRETKKEGRVSRRTPDIEYLARVQIDRKGK